MVGSVINPDRAFVMQSILLVSSTCALQAVGVMNQLALELDINSAVDNIRDVVLELLNCERVTLFLVDTGQKELR